MVLHLAKVGKESTQVTPEAENFLSFYEKNYQSITTESLKQSGKTRSAVTQKNDDCITLYVNYPEDTSDPIKNLSFLVSSAQDISALHRLTAAEFTTTNTNNSVYTIQLSKEEVKKTLDPMVEKSKEYLIAKGFTSEEIQQMLLENKADESDLVTLVLLMTNEECKQKQDAEIAKEQSNYNFFATPCRANVYSAAFDCGIEAVGLDIFSGLTQSAAKTWSKAIIKRVFKDVAEKALGPVGVVIAVADFGWCMHKRGYLCIYSIKTPIEKKYEGYIGKVSFNE